MEIFVEHYTNKREVFKRANQILKQNGLYYIDDKPEEGKGYTLEYWFHDACDIYEVIKGPENDAFHFIIPICLNIDDNMYLDQGEILVFHHEDNGKAWFTCVSILLQVDVMDPEYATGFTSYGSLSQMIDMGLIAQKTDTAKPRKKKKPAKPEIQFEQQAQKEAPIVLPSMPEIVVSEEKNDEAIEDETGEDSIFKTIARTFEKLKTVTRNILDIRRYINRKENLGIKTLKVTQYMYLSPGYGYFTVPQLRLKGRWLERAGFKAGDFVQLITMQGMVLIVPVSQNTPYDNEF